MSLTNSIGCVTSVIVLSLTMTWKYYPFNIIMWSVISVFPINPLLNSLVFVYSKLICKPKSKLSSPQDAPFQKSPSAPLLSSSPSAPTLPSNPSAPSLSSPLAHSIQSTPNPYPYNYCGTTCPTLFYSSNHP